MTERHCRECDVPHADNFKDESSDDDEYTSSGGMGRIIPWVDGRCAACVDRRRELTRRAARIFVAYRLDPDDSYCDPLSEPDLDPDPETRTVPAGQTVVEDWG